MSKRGLIVVDLQNEYLPTGKLPLSGIEAAAANAARAMADAREKGIPIFHIRHEFASGEAPVFVSGTEGVEIQPAVRFVGQRGRRRPLLDRLQRRQGSARRGAHQAMQGFAPAADADRVDLLCQPRRDILDQPMRSQMQIETQRAQTILERQLDGGQGALVWRSDGRRFKHGRRWTRLG